MFKQECDKQPVHTNVRGRCFIFTWGFYFTCNRPTAIEVQATVPHSNLLTALGVWVFLFVMVKPLYAEDTLNGGSAARSHNSQDAEDTLTVGDAARAQSSHDAEDTFTVGDAARSRSSHNAADTLNAGSAARSPGAAEHSRILAECARGELFDRGCADFASSSQDAIDKYNERCFISWSKHESWLGRIPIVARDAEDTLNVARSALSSQDAENTFNGGLAVFAQKSQDASDTLSVARADHARRSQGADDLQHHALTKAKLPAPKLPSPKRPLPHMAKPKQSFNEVPKLPVPTLPVPKLSAQKLPVQHLLAAKRPLPKPPMAHSARPKHSLTEVPKLSVPTLPVMKLPVPKRRFKNTLHPDQSCNFNPLHHASSKQCLPASVQRTLLSKRIAHVQGCPKKACPKAARIVHSP